MTCQMAALLEPRGGSSRTICCHALLDIFSRLMPALLQLQGGGLVPLSHAICCRPCLPEELPDSGGRISPDDKGVAIVSIGCHAATGELCRSAPAGRWAIEPHTCNSACGQGQMPSHPPCCLCKPHAVLACQAVSCVYCQADACGCPLTKCAAGPGSQSLQCEPQGSSFVTGFSQAVRVASTLNAFYPIGNVDCCTPSVLLSSGE